MDLDYLARRGNRPYALGNMAKIAFLGLGAMGGPLARHLAEAGHSLTVYNRTPARAEAWVAAHGGQSAATPAEAAAAQEVVIACVGEDKDVEAITLGPDGAFAAIAPGALFIDHTSASAQLARRLSDDAVARGFEALDAPVTGGEIGAEAGDLVVMCGGSDAAFARAEPLVRTYASRVVHMGGPGAGQTAKMANQAAIAGTLQAMVEAMRFARTAGLDLDAMFEVMSGGCAASWQVDHRWHEIAAETRPFGFWVGWLRKDIGLTLDEARRIGAPMPSIALIEQFFAEIEAQGGGRPEMRRDA